MDEKTRVKEALQTPLVLDQVWQPIATAWFDKWKEYVNYDAVEDVKGVGGRHPGPVDNGPLKGSFGDELRRDLVAERDYVLLPHECAESLVKQYSGGPTFPRKAKCVDSFNGRSMEVDLWPVRVNLYLCDRNHPTPDPLGPSFKRRYFLSGMTLPELINDVKTLLLDIDMTKAPTRCWLSETPPDPEAIDTGMGRRLTTDMVEWDGNWHVIGSSLSRRLKDIRGDGDFIELILEVAPWRNPKPSEWPRSHLLEAWKGNIHKSDMIDARDSHGDFNAATVVHVNAAGDLVVRYWNGDFDWILTKDFVYRIAPLHSHSSAASVPEVDMTAPSTLVTHERSSEMPPATKDEDEGCSVNEEEPGTGQKAKVQCSEGHCGGVQPPRGGSGVAVCSDRDSGIRSTSPLAANDDKVPTEAAHVVLAIHLRRALQAHSITTPRVDAVLQMLRDEEVSSLAVWQALTPSEVSSLLETHRETLPLGLRTAMRLIHGAAASL